MPRPFSPKFVKANLKPLELTRLTAPWATGLLKIRSVKIMRRIVRKIASRKLDELGDTSKSFFDVIAQEF